MKKHSRVAGILAAFLVVVGVALFSKFIQRERDRTRDAYSLWWAGSIVARAIEDESIEGKGSFEDFRPEFEKLVEVSGEPFTFEEISARVDVDVALIKQSLGSDGGRSRYVKLKNKGTYEVFAGTDPNERIRKAIRDAKHQGEPTGAEDVTEAND